jgi:hypothetical protein
MTCPLLLCHIDYGAQHALHQDTVNSIRVLYPMDAIAVHC